MNVDFLGRNVINYLKEQPTENIKVSLDTFIDTESTVKLHNGGGIWLGGSNSILNGIEYKGERVHIYENDFTILDGLVTNGFIDNDTFVLKIQSRIAKIFDYPITYINTNTNPALAIIGILEGINYHDWIDYPSFYQANNYYVKNNVSIGVYYYTESGVTFKTAIDELATIGSAYVYRNGNKISFRIFELNPGTSLYDISESDMLNYPRTTAESQDGIYNDYAIQYLVNGGIPATDAGGAGYGAQTRTGNIGRKSWSVDYGYQNRIQINNRDTAYALGDLKMLRDRYAKTSLSFNLRLDKIPVEPGRIYKVTSSDHGWTSQNARLMGIKKNLSVITGTFQEIK